MRVKTGWRGREVSGMVDGGSVGGGGGAAEAIGGLGSVEWMRVFVFFCFFVACFRANQHFPYNKYKKQVSFLNCFTPQK